MKTRHPLLVELMDDIDRGKVQPKTSLKNLESILMEFVDEYQGDYDAMIKDLEEYNYVSVV